MAPVLRFLKEPEKNRRIIVNASPLPELRVSAPSYGVPVRSVLRESPDTHGKIPVTYVTSRTRATLRRSSLQIPLIIIDRYYEKDTCGPAGVVLMTFLPSTLPAPG